MTVGFFLGFFLAFLCSSSLDLANHIHVEFSYGRRF